LLGDLKDLCPFPVWSRTCLTAQSPANLAGPDVSFALLTVGFGFGLKPKGARKVHPWSIF